MKKLKNPFAKAPERSLSSIEEEARAKSVREELARLRPEEIDLKRNKTEAHVRLLEDPTSENEKSFKEVESLHLAKQREIRSLEDSAEVFEQLKVRAQAREQAEAIKNGFIEVEKRFNGPAFKAKRYKHKPEFEDSEDLGSEIEYVVQPLISDAEWLDEILPEVCARIQRLESNAILAFSSIPIKDSPVATNSPLGTDKVRGMIRMQLRKYGLNWAATFFGDQRTIQPLTEYFENAKAWALKMDPNRSQETSSEGA